MTPDIVASDATAPDALRPGALLPERHACNEHAVQFYHSDEFLVGELAAYVATGLREGESVIVLATEAHRDASLQRIEAGGIDAQAAQRSGALTLLDAGDTLRQIMGARGVDPADFHALIGGAVAAAIQRSQLGRARAYGEMVDLLWRDGDRAGALALEEMWNELLLLHPIPLLCAYAMDRFGSDGDGDADAFDEVCRVHGHVFPTEAYARGDERARLAEIARLQQRAVMLEAEVGRRRTLEAQLRDALAERDSLLERERAARADAEAANEAKSVFLAAMSHELRTPLNAIAGYVDLLGSGVYGTVTDAQRAPLERIQYSQRHLLAMINDVLNFARIEVGHVEYQHDAIAVPALFTQVEALIQRQFERRAIALRFEPCECTVAADGDRTLQVLLNLLSNSLKFTSPGGAVSVTARPADPGVEITVRDTGCGIPAAQLDAIFDPFVQVGRRLSQPREGVGLGLAISRDLARGMRGELRAESEEGVGSAFTLALPRIVT